MDKGKVQVFCGPGWGKTAMAVGKGVIASANSRKVIMIQFLKGNLNSELADGLKMLEPAMKVFRFEKSCKSFAELNEEEKREERFNIRNGLNFAKKVLSTGECDLLILDEVLGIIDQGVVSCEEIIEFLSAREEGTCVIMTGKVFPKELEPYVDFIARVENDKVDKECQ